MERRSLRRIGVQDVPARIEHVECGGEFSIQSSKQSAFAVSLLILTRRRRSISAHAFESGSRRSAARWFR